MRRHLQADHAYLAVVADPEGAKDLVEALKSNRPSPISYTTETKPEVLREDKEIAVYPLAISAERLRIVPAAELFEK